MVADPLTKAARSAMLGVALVAGLGTGSAAAQSQTRPGPPAAATTEVVLDELLARPIDLRTGIGRAHEAIATRVPRAQRFYDQGVAYLHSYSWIEAARSFAEAVRADDQAALAYVGLSYALGEVGQSTGARAASARASALAAKLPARERFRVELRARQLAAADAPGNAAAAQAYRALLARIGSEFATDVELLLLAGHAQDPADGHGMSGGSASLAFYERARQLAPDYFAIDHYTAHAYENLGKPEAALPFAQRFAEKAPAIPHAHHMYGHTLRQVDRMREAIAEFETADRLHHELASRERLPLRIDWHYRHNLDLLATAYQYSGQMQRAATRLKESFDLTAPGRLAQSQDVNKRDWPLYLLARQRPQEALTAARQLQAHAAPLLQALGHILASRALAATGDLAGAAKEGNAALAGMRTMGPAGGTLRPDFELAQGEFRLRAGDAAGGALLKAGLTKFAADRSPDAWITTVFQLEAAVQLTRELARRDQPASLTLAGELAAQLRQHAPHYPGTHYQLARLAELQGNAAAAQAEYRDAIARWQNADRDLPELADARARLAALSR